MGKGKWDHLQSGKDKVQVRGEDKDLDLDQDQDQARDLDPSHLPQIKTPIPVFSPHLTKEDPHPNHRDVDHLVHLQKNMELVEE